MHGFSIGRLNEKIGREEVEAFVCCASFEERSEAIVQHLDPDRISHLWIGYNRDYKPVSHTHIEAMKSHIGSKFTMMELDTRDPIVTGDELARHVDTIFQKQPTRIVVDITAFTRESLLILLKLLANRCGPMQSVEFVYLRAREYSVGDRDDRKWLSKGNREVRSVLGFPGSVVPWRKTHLIVLVGFEDDRALSLIREFEPARISLGIGGVTEPAAEAHYNVNRDRLNRLRIILDPDEVFEFNGYDAVATRDVVRSVMAKAPGYNTVIAPMNTKISAVGVGAVALEDQSVQVCYAEAEVYNVHNYSSSGDEVFWFKMEDML